MEEKVEVAGNPRMRSRNRSLFLFALSWFPALRFGSLVLAIIIIREKPSDYPWPIFGIALIAAKKVAGVGRLCS
jgi:hypothetical protein